MATHSKNPSELKAVSGDGEGGGDLVAAVLETAGAFIVVLDCEGRIIRFNRACEEGTGYKFDEVRGRTLWDFLLVPDEVEAVKRVFNSLKQGEIPSQFKNYWVKKDGERRLIDWRNTVLTDSAGAVQFVIGVGIDNTQQSLNEEELRLSLKELADIKFALDESSIVAITDQTGIIKYVNDKFCEISKYSQEELLGQDHRIINSSFHP